MYTAKENGDIYYIGNNINSPKIIDLKGFDLNICKHIVQKIHNDEKYYHLSCIDNGVFYATIAYFNKINSYWCNLPLTTLMISSPGEVYAGQKLDYTTDALPIEVPSWFGSGKRIFLAESSQFYLELTLLIKQIQSVFSIYNSFRKEKSDGTHLSEFQHIEYEGKVNLGECKRIFIGLFEYIFNYLHENNKNNLLYFISTEQLEDKRNLVSKGPVTIDLKDALDLLYKDTNNDKYKELSLKNFGAWEEIRLTELLGSNIIVEKFPMMQIPFYHAIAEQEYEGVPLAKNADFILFGYRETIGAGERIANKEALLKKSEIFNLPKEDYLPYVQSRDFADYNTTSGFGMGRQRLVQWLTDQPTIYDSTIIPRTHLIPNP